MWLRGLSSKAIYVLEAFAEAKNPASFANERNKLKIGGIYITSDFFTFKTAAFYFHDRWRSFTTQSRKYIFIKVWYGIPTRLDSSLK